jgi:hypothetical protein
MNDRDSNERKLAVLIIVAAIAWAIFYPYKGGTFYPKPQKNSIEAHVISFLE